MKRRLSQARKMLCAARCVAIVPHLANTTTFGDFYFFPYQCITIWRCDVGRSMVVLYWEVPMFQALWFSHACLSVMHTFVSILMLKYFVYCLQVIEYLHIYLSREGRHEFDISRTTLHTVFVSFVGAKVMSRFFVFCREKWLFVTFPK